MRAERRLRQTQAQRDLDATRARVDAAFQALDGVSDASSSQALAALAKAAFEAGEVPLAELLDVYSSQADQELTRLTLEWEARLAVLELERLTPQGE